MLSFDQRQLDRSPQTVGLKNATDHFNCRSGILKPANWFAVFIHGIEQILDGQDMLVNLLMQTLNRLNLSHAR